MFEELFNKSTKLSYELKRKKTNTWELRAVAEMIETCNSASTIDGFVNGFHYRLAEYKLDSSWHLKTAYKAVAIDSNTAHVYWCNGTDIIDSPDVLIAVITKLKK